MSGSARRTGWGSGWAEGRLAGSGPHTLKSTLFLPRFHPDF